MVALRHGELELERKGRLISGLIKRRFLRESRALLVVWGVVGLVCCAVWGVVWGVA